MFKAAACGPQFSKDLAKFSTLAPEVLAAFANKLATCLAESPCLENMFILEATISADFDKSILPVVANPATELNSSIT